DVVVCAAACVHPCDDRAVRAVSDELGVELVARGRTYGYTIRGPLGNPRRIQALSVNVESGCGAVPVILPSDDHAALVVRHDLGARLVKGCPAHGGAAQDPFGEGASRRTEDAKKCAD